MLTRRRASAAGLVAFAAVTSGSALAQTAPGVSLPTREEIERGVREGTLEQNRGPVGVDAAAVERAPCPLASPDFGGIRLKIESVEFSGAERVPEVDLSESYRPYLGTEQPVAVICEIRDRAATQLRSAGSFSPYEKELVTRSGRKQLDREAQEWNQTTSIVARFFEPAGEQS